MTLRYNPRLMASSHITSVKKPVRKPLASAYALEARLSATRQLMGSQVEDKVLVQITYENGKWVTS